MDITHAQLSLVLPPHAPPLSVQLHAAFSRDQVQKEYVQHHMEAHANEVWSILCDSGEGRRALLRPGLAADQHAGCAAAH